MAVPLYPLGLFWIGNLTSRKVSTATNLGMLENEAWGWRGMGCARSIYCTDRPKIQYLCTRFWARPSILRRRKSIVHSLFSESDECSEAYFSWLRLEGLKRTTKLSLRYLTCEILRSVVELLD